jgi:hypothetical protein
MFAFKDVCEVTGLAEKSNAARRIEVTRKRGSRIDR